MESYHTPDNLLDLLNGVINAAAMTPFYGPLLPDHPRLTTLADLTRIPVTPLKTYRAQRLADVLADASAVQWIVGPYRGQIPTAVAVAEGHDDAAYGYDLLADAIEECLQGEREPTCAVVSSPERRYFAAEVAGICIDLGIPAHVFIDYGKWRTYQRLHLLRPDLLVILSDRLNEADLPPDVALCLTFRRSHVMKSFRQLDIYLIDELGFLAKSTDCQRYVLNQDVYYFERSDTGHLVVTSLYNNVRPVLRLETMDRVMPLGQHTLQFTELSAIP